MRSLRQDETVRVAGGGNEEDAADRALTVCNMNNLPDNTEVKISTSTAGGVGAMGTFTKTDTTIEATTTCGELREAAAKEAAAKGGS